MFIILRVFLKNIIRPNSKIKTSKHNSEKANLVILSQKNEIYGNEKLTQ